MKTLYTASIGKPWKGIKPNDRRKLNLKGKNHGRKTKK